ncbi:MAG: sigma-70 family RNA polymerase sigma factor [Butyrivibrio sp.]|nr:sigma-70 family RNA polymerase sigma factor [Butyrivibrio sp.]
MMEFEQIYRTYFKSVYLYILKLSGNKHLAEEITSETFLKAMKSIGDFRGECDMRVWLCQIAKNAYYSYLKRSNRIVNIDEAELQNVADVNVSIEERLGTQEEVRKIRKVLHTMSNPYKEVFMWRVFGELSFKEIGTLYGKTDNWACVTYHRAKKMIQSRLEGINNEKRV